MAQLPNYAGGTRTRTIIPKPKWVTNPLALTMTYRQCDLDLRCLALFLLSYCKTITVGFEPTLPERQSGVLTATLWDHISFFCLYVYYNIFFKICQIFFKIPELCRKGIRHPRIYGDSFSTNQAGFA